ncbi:glycosyltransferase family 2 protein [Alteribacillus sp. HJP-4]|uniref:glycosyltransferase family 2 protein n=1 Tax=Alteribacillus sp. HJP-4 TaxID=2775394 RepID=UPI0035CD3D03
MNTSGLKELISVIIPTRNREKLLSQAVNSVLQQTHEHLELIIVDEASDDGTEEYIKSIDDQRIHYIRHDQPKGGNIARNNGFKQAAGDYIAFLDDDDIWSRKKLEKQYAAMKKHPDAGMVSCNNLVFNEKGSILRQSSRGSNKYYSQKEALQKILIDNFIGGASFPLIRRECLEKVNGFREHLKSAQETDLYVRIIHAGYGVFICEDPLILYRVHSNNRITDSFEPKLQGLEELYRYKKDNILLQLNDETAIHVTEEHIMKLSEVYIRNKNYKKFLEVKKNIEKNDLDKNALLRAKIQGKVLKNRLSHTPPGRGIKTLVQSAKSRKLNSYWQQYIKTEFPHK